MKDKVTESTAKADKGEVDFRTMFQQNWGCLIKRKSSQKY